LVKLVKKILRYQEKKRNLLPEWRTRGGLCPWSAKREGNQAGRGDQNTNLKITEGRAKLTKGLFGQNGQGVVQKNQGGDSPEIHSPPARTEKENSKGEKHPKKSGGKIRRKTAMPTAFGNQIKKGGKLRKEADRIPNWETHREMGGRRVRWPKERETK